MIRKQINIIHQSKYAVVGRRRWMDVGWVNWIQIKQQYNCSCKLLMLIQACRQLLRRSKNLFLPSFATTKKLNTQLFSDLSYGELANPQLTKSLIIKPTHMHSRVSQRSLFQRKRVSRKIVTCFSEKKHKVYRRVHKLRRQFYSDLLGQKIFITLSTKAFRTIQKMGSFDNYILCTKPYNLDSKYGEYLRELMLRKINDKNFRIPYIVGTNRKFKTKNFRKHEYINSVGKITIPKDVKSSLRTFQRKFGTVPEELTNEDYSKYVQLQNLKRTLGDQMEPTHPLLLELKGKMNRNTMSEEQQKRFNQMAIDAEQAYVNDPKHGEANRKRVQKAKHDIEMLNIKLQEMRYKVENNQTQ